MLKSIFIFGMLLLSSMSLHDETKIIEEFKSALQKGLSSSIKKYLPNVLEEIKRIVFLNRLRGEGRNNSLNPTVIVKAIQHLLSDTIPVMPLAVAEPSGSNILIFVGISNSYIFNMSQSSIDASVINTNSSTSIEINLHTNSGSMEGLYELDVSSYDLHLYGDGNYSLIFSDLDISITTVIEIFQDNSFIMSNFLINFKVQNTQLLMSNLLGGDPAVQPVIEFIQKILPAEVIALDPFIQEIVNSTVSDFTNSFLAKSMSWDDIVLLIQFLADF